MRIVATPVTRPFNDLLRRYARASRPATRQFAIDTMAHVLTVAMRIAAREALDTGRYLRAWQEAYNDLGSGPPTPLVSLTPGRHSAGFRAALLKQLKAADARIAQLDKEIEELENSQLWPKARERQYNIVWRLRARREKAYKQRDRAAAYLHLLLSAPKNAPIVMIGGRATKNPLALTSLARPYARVYGGYSVVHRLGNRWIVRSFNREPHARIVESGGMRTAASQATGVDAVLKIPPHRIVARSLAGLRAGGGAGLRVAASKYKKAVAAAGRAK